MLAMKCPSCGHSLEIHDSQIGLTIVCPSCGKGVLAESSTKQSISADSATLNPARKGTAEDPRALPQRYDFLAPAQGPNELGRLAQYRVDRLLGYGGMGMVFLAFDTQLQRSVALKVLKPEASKDSEYRERFLREARTTASVKSDHIVTIHQVGQENDVTYLAMEFIQGQPLKRWITDNPRPSTEEILRIACEITQGLAAAHERGLIHRDIKPANILLEEPRGRVKILDFGLARPARDDASLTEPGLIVGTPEYMAPEQAEGQAVDARCDLFSLGCVFYELAGGGKAFAARNTMAVLKAVALREPPSLLLANPALPRAFCQLVMQLMAKQPADRPASANAVLDTLRQLRADPNLQLPAEPLRPAAKKGRRGWWLLTPVAALALLGLGAYLAGFRLTGPASPSTDSGASHGPRPTAQGVSSQEIVLGISAPFSGPSQELGREIEVGINTYFGRVNDEGGIFGRKFRLVPLDDGYDPDRALANMKELDTQHKVLGFIGNVGTPTAIKALPYAVERRMLFFGAFTGAPLLREVPPSRFVFNYRASYEEETAAIVRHLLRIRHVKPQEIAVFAQQDGYGDAGFRGVAKELRRHDRDAAAILRVGYERNKLDVDAAVKTVLDAKDIKAVVMVPTYKQAALFIKRVKDKRPDMIFSNVSFVGSDALAEELMLLGANYAEGVIVTQVVPHPDSTSSLVLQYRADLKKHRPNARPNFTSLEGYIDAMLLAEAVRRAGDNLNTDTLIDALEGIHNLDLGLGTLLTYGRSDHQASQKVWGTVLNKEGKYEVLDLEQ
jgi:serine/threonine protein kinase/ABC-type branched-subunit amino acid transport system substrate-binding protein